MLRHEQLTTAQERIRERRNALGHEVDGLETGLPPQSELEKERKTAESRLTDARKAAATAAGDRTKAQQALAEEEPRWQQWVERRERSDHLLRRLQPRPAGRLLGGCHHPLTRLGRNALSGIVVEDITYCCP